MKITLMLESTNEPKLIFSNVGGRTICQDIDLVRNILQPVEQMLHLTINLDDGKPEMLIKHFAKSQVLFSKDYGEWQKEVLFDMHRTVVDINPMMLYSFNQYVLATMTVTKM